MYDVLYVDPKHHARTLARGLGREAACEVAREEARRLHVGRMFAAGSNLEPIGDIVLIVESERSPAAA